MRQLLEGGVTTTALGACMAASNGPASTCWKSPSATPHSTSAPSTATTPLAILPYSTPIALSRSLTLRTYTLPSSSFAHHLSYGQVHQTPGLRASRALRCVFRDLRWRVVRAHQRAVFEKPLLAALPPTHLGLQGTVDTRTGCRRGSVCACAYVCVRATTLATRNTTGSISGDLSCAEIHHIFYIRLPIRVSGTRCARKTCNPFVPL